MSEANNENVWHQWRSDALARLDLEAIYGDVLTGKSKGNGWLEARDPASPSGDRDPIRRRGRWQRRSGTGSVQKLPR